MFFYYDSDLMMLLLFVAVAMLVISLMRRRMSSAAKPTSASASAAKPQATEKERMAEDMKATKTSQVADAVSILNDLSATSDNYRHYCELVGNSMASSNIIAPYSKRAVAYYDIKCYRIDATYNGGEKETLVAHEHSFDPFFFTDASCDTPIYVDLESFGNNVILVNSTNHIEGPNSDFAKAFQQSATGATSGTSAGYAMVSHAVQAGANVVFGIANTLRRALTPAPALQPALALASGGSMPLTSIHEAPRNVMFAGPDGPTHRGGGHGPQQPTRGSSTFQVGNTTVHVNTGYTRPPAHLGDFMGGYGGGHWVVGGGPGYNPRPQSANSAEILLGMGLGALLSSMQTTQQQLSTTGGQQQNTFRGYRLVENIVPLGSPIYCIGEIYKHGTDVYMGRSLAKDYPTSYFATKPESEILSTMGAR